MTVTTFKPCGDAFVHIPGTGWRCSCAATDTAFVADKLREAHQRSLETDALMRSFMRGIV